MKTVKKGRPKQRTGIFPSFYRYTYLIRLSFFSPRTYVEKVSSEDSLIRAVIFFVLTFITSSVLKFLVEFFDSKNLALVFLAVPQTLFLVPFAIFFYLSSGIVLFLLSKMFAGQSQFKKTLIVLFFSSAPMILFFDPLLQPVIIILSIYILFLSIKRVHNLNWSKTVLVVILPFLLLILALQGLGIINLLNMLNFHFSL